MFHWVGPKDLDSWRPTAERFHVISAFLWVAVVAFVGQSFVNEIGLSPCRWEVEELANVETQP